MRNLRALLPVLAGLGMLAAAPVAPRPISFEERVAAQRTIERFYYARQIGATQPFEAVYTNDLLERKAARGVQLSMALESIWNIPITAERLRQEGERISRDTRFPDRLAELYAALGNDP